MRADAIYGMHHTYTKYVQMGSYGDVYPQWKDKRELRNAMLHHMEDIMVFFAPKQTFGRVDSFGHQCMKILRTSYEDAQTARSMEALLLAMQCP